MLLHCLGEQQDRVLYFECACFLSSLDSWTDVCADHTVLITDLQHPCFADCPRPTVWNNYQNLYVALQGFTDFYVCGSVFTSEFVCVCVCARGSRPWLFPSGACSGKVRMRFECQSLPGLSTQRNTSQEINTESQSAVQPLPHTLTQPSEPRDSLYTLK